MTKRKTKFLSLILSLMLFLVSVPLSVFADQPDEIESAEETTTAPAYETEAAESDTSSDEQQSIEQITVIDDGLISDQTIEPIEQGHINEIAATAATASWSTSDILPDGIYSFSRKANVNQFMQALNNSTQAGAQMIVLQHSVCPSINYSQYATFKVTRVSNTTNRYIIRLMSNENLTLAFSGNNVVTKEIPANDSDVSIQDTFIINAYDGGGFTIQPYGTGYYVCSSGGSGTNIIKGSLGSTAVWKPRGYRSYIEDGVYMFENHGNTSLYMSIESDTYQSEKHMLQSNIYSIDGTFKRQSILKITQIGNTGQYTIRLMTNNLLTFGANSSNEAVSEYIPLYDSDVEDEQTYYIVYDFSGYMIIPCGTRKAVAATENSTASGTSGAPESYLTFIDRNTPRNSARWDIYKYSGSDRSAIYTIPNQSFVSKGPIVDEQYELSLYLWSTIPFTSNTSISAYSSDTRVADVSYNRNTCSVTVKVKYFGIMLLRIGIYKTTGGAPQTLYNGAYQYYAVPREGTYYIQNKYSQKYADIEGPSTAEGAIVQQWEFHTGSQEKWQIEHVYNSGGYVRLKSLYSGKYLGVVQSDLSKIKQLSSQGDTTLWRFELLDDYSVKMICKASEAYSKVLAVPLNSTGDGVDLTQRAYTDDNDYSDEWYLQDTFVYIEFKYDYGYILRHKRGSELDSTVSDRISNSIINDIFPQVQYAFEQQCGLSMILKQTVIPSYTSDADLCNLDINEHCQCITDNQCILEYDDNPNYNNSINGFQYPVHCKSLIRIRNNLINEIQDNTITVAYTGHAVCMYDNGNHNYTTHGLADYNYPIVAICQSQVLRKQSILVLAHELTHLFGIDHHQPISGQYCIMDENRYSNNDPDNPDTYWCDNCLNTIARNILKY